MSTVIQFPGRDARPLGSRVSEEIRALMGRHGVSQVRLARWLGIDQTGISARLRGETEWKVSELDLVADGFGVHPAELLGGYVGDHTPPDGGIPILRARDDSNVQPSDPKVRPRLRAVA